MFVPQKNRKKSCKKMSNQRLHKQHCLYNEDDRLVYQSNHQTKTVVGDGGGTAPRLLGFWGRKETLSSICFTVRPSLHFSDEIPF